jgi:mannose/fructose/N-acetylgalactosamine-specific phosphotransferase system component IIC
VKPLPSDARRAIALLYLAAAIIIFEQLAEILALIYPFHSSIASWRFGLLGITVSRTASFALADMMILGAAILLEHRTFLRLVGIVHLLVAALLVPIMGIYSLDVLVLRRALKPEFVRGFDLTAVRTLLTCGIAILAAVLVFWSTYRMKPVRSEKKEAARDVLLPQLPVKELE